MSPVPCRIILVDHTSRRPLWDAAPAATPAGALVPIDPRPFAAWDVSPLADVFEVGTGRRSLLDLVPGWGQLQACKGRLCYERARPYLLLILEKRERTLADVPAMRREIDALLALAPPLAEPLSPWPAPAPLGTPAPQQRLGLTPTYAAALPPGVRVLVLVDDNMPVRIVCHRILQDHFLIFETCDSLDALDLAQRLPFPIAVLVSDVSLPKLDGVALARLWRQRRRETGVLLLSGNAYVPGLPAPDIAFMSKPFIVDELVRTALRLATPADNLVQACSP